MNDLTKQQKLQFEKQIERISNKDEENVLKSIENELLKLQSIFEENHSHKIELLIKNAKLLLEILIEKDFPMAISTRKWIIFGLSYLISDIDLIPDAIPIIGYSDDALVLQWVIYMIDKDISRYNIYKKAKNSINNDQILETIQEGKNHHEYIIIPGFLTGINNPETNEFWIEKASQFNDEIANSTIKILRWNLSHLKEFSNVLRIIDHQLTLKPAYESLEFGIEWHQVKQEFTQLGNAIGHNLMKSNIENNNTIHLISFDIGGFAAIRAIELLPSNFVKTLINFGGAFCIEDIPQIQFMKVSHIYNYFSSNDLVLKFIYDNFEKYKNPIGLAPFMAGKDINIININASTKIKSHCDYKNYFAELDS